MAPPAPAAAVHPPTFESAPLEGQPTRRSDDSLSLSAVFGDEAPPAGPTSPGTVPAGVETEEAGPTFDQFFGTTAAPQAETTPEPAASGSGANAPVEDLDQFNAWLRGLKR
jgi:hypothetical protein